MRIRVIKNIRIDQGKIIRKGTESEASDQVSENGSVSLRADTGAMVFLFPEEFEILEEAAR